WRRKASSPPIAMKASGIRWIRCATANCWKACGRTVTRPGYARPAEEAILAAVRFDGCGLFHIDLKGRKDRARLPFARAQHRIVKRIALRAPVARLRRQPLGLRGIVEIDGDQ